MNFVRRGALACLAAGVAIVPAVSWGATLDYRAVLKELNNSGVSGVMNFTLDTDAQTLRVAGAVSGLAPDQVHVQHIHGRFDDAGNPINSEVPDASLDADGDGALEVLEAAPAYGDVLLGLVNSPADLLAGNFLSPFSNAAGNLAYDVTFDVSNDELFFSTVLGTDYDGEDILPLDLREYVIHGAFVSAGISDDLPDGGYLATLPVAAAEISAVPLPASALLLVGGLGALGFARRRKVR